MGLPFGRAVIAARKRARSRGAGSEVALKCPVRFLHAGQDATFHLESSQNRDEAPAARSVPHLCSGRYRVDLIDFLKHEQAPQPCLPADFRGFAEARDVAGAVRGLRRKVVLNVYPIAPPSEATPDSRMKGCPRAKY